MASPLRSLSRSISKKIGRSGSTSRLLNGDKLTLDDNMEIQDDEFSWPVKMKSEETPGKKVERTLVVGPTGLRLLVPTTHEELGKYPYTKMKEYTYNIGHKVFQFTWNPTKELEETIFLSTNKSQEIHEMIGKFLTNLLREKKGIKDPEKILTECTYQRPPEVDKIKRGGTQRSYSTPAKKMQRRPKGSGNTQVSASPSHQGSKPRTGAGSSEVSSPQKKKIEEAQDDIDETDEEDSSNSDNTPNRNRSSTKKSTPSTRTPDKKKEPKKEDSDEGEDQSSSDDDSSSDTDDQPPARTQKKRSNNGDGRKTLISQSAPVSPARVSPKKRSN